MTGGGDTGAIIWGSPEEHRVAVSTTRFFLPANSNRQAPRLAEKVPAIRDALIGGEARAAADTLAAALEDAGESGDMVWTDPIVPCATLRIRSDDLLKPVENYRRHVELRTGVATLSWEVAGEQRRIEVAAQRGTGRVFIRVSGSHNFRVDIAPKDAPTAEASAIPAPNYANLVNVHVDEIPGRVSVTVKALGARNPLDARDSGIVTCIVPDKNSEFHRKIRSSATFCLSVGVEELVPTAETFDAVVAGEADGLRGCAFDNFMFCLDGDEDEPVTEDLWEAARAGDALAENRVVATTVAMGRMNIFSSTLDLPATLQGVWQGTWQPAWSSDYTLNGNVQNGTIASLAVTGTPDLLLSFFRLVKPHAADFADNAARIFGAPGWMLPARMTSHGRANHFHPDFPHQFWWGSGGWALRIAWEYFTTTGDTNFVHETALPLARQVTAFYEGALWTDRFGVRHAVPCYSPENTPSNSSTPLSVDATSELLMIRDAYRLANRLAHAVSSDEIFPVPKLPDTTVENGIIPEWLGWKQLDRVGHRHASQLYDLWYEDPGWLHDESMRTAAIELIKAKLAWRCQDPRPTPGHMEMAFGLVQLGLAAARLQCPDLAHKCALLLARDHWGLNGVSLHDGGAIFNLDASGGLPALVAAMLIDSTSGSVTLFPALPLQWPSGIIQGARLRGGILLDELRWDTREATARIRALPETQAARNSDVLLMRSVNGWRFVDGSTEFHLNLSRSMEVRLVRDSCL